MRNVQEKKNFYEKRLKLLDKVVGDLSFQIAVLLNQLGKDKATNRRVWRLVVAMLEDASSITNKMLLPEALSRGDDEPVLVYPDEEEWDKIRLKALAKKFPYHDEDLGLSIYEIMKALEDDDDASGM